MFETDHTLQPCLFAFSHRDLVADDSDVWLYADLFASLNLSDFENSYKGQGQIAKDPELILRTVFYALTHGVRSGRRLEDFCRNDNRYIVLSGDSRPDRRTLDRFIVRHALAIDRLFVKVVHLAQEMGLVKLGRISIDGSKFKAYAGRPLKYESMDKAVSQILGELAELKKDLQSDEKDTSSKIDSKLEKIIRNKEKRLRLIEEAKMRIDERFEKSEMKESKKNARKPKSIIGIHDKDALSMGASAKFKLGYNVQAAVDGDHQIIVASDVHDTPNDAKALPNLLDQVKSNTGKSADKVMADAGYFSLENLVEVKNHQSVPYISPKRGCLEQGSAYEQISKTSENYVCLAGEFLTIKSRSKAGDRMTFDLENLNCSNCSFASSCHLVGKKSVNVPTGKNWRYLKNYMIRSRTKRFKDIYKERQQTVEPVFGNIKNKGLQIYVRGKEKVSLWWRLVCTAHNIEKIIKFQTLSAKLS